jgi:hypothetical protein
MKKGWLHVAAMTASVAVVVPAAPVLPAAKGVKAEAAHPIVATRRLTESQYRHAIANIFGADIRLNARFEPGKREAGLLAIGNSQLSLTSSGFEQYFSMARSIADQALDAKHRDAIVGCRPADPKAADEACATQFVQKYGALLFRRPLTPADVATRVAIAGKGAAQKGDFYAGLKLSLASLLMAPEFLFRIERAEPDPAQRGQLRLDGYTKASRLSYLIWDSEPDAELLQAAASGALHTQAGLERQLTRMTESPRMQAGVEAFFSDMLQLDQLDGLTKDAASYPKFSQAVVDAAREQTLRTLVDLLVTRGGDYRDIFTNRTTFLNRPLAAVYNVQFLGGSDSWTRFTFPEDSGRSGVLTEFSFLSMFSHPGRSSPTRRGVKVNEIFMCLPTPEPPPNVDFSKVQATAVGTVRTRLLDHMTNPGCAGCHRLSDPVGLTLERFDGIGGRRTTENGIPIDVSADLYGRKFSGAAGLGQVLHDDPRTPACLTQQVYAYGVGRQAMQDDEAFLESATQAFAGDGYRMKALYRRIGSSPQFFRVVLPEQAKLAPPAGKVALAEPRRSRGVSQ